MPTIAQIRHNRNVAMPKIETDLMKDGYYLNLFEALIKSTPITITIRKKKFKLKLK